MLRTGTTNWKLRWKKVWTTPDGRGNVQKYIIGNGLNVYDAWCDGKHLGESHRLKDAKDMVRQAVTVCG